MTSEVKVDFKQRIVAEMTSDYSNALERNFDLAKQFIRITKDGHVELLVKDQVTGVDQILLYLIGKLYAKEAGFSTSEYVANEELLRELGVKKGSLLPWQKQLRDDNMIKQVNSGKNTTHAVGTNYVEQVLKQIDRKLKSK